MLKYQLFDILDYPFPPSETDLEWKRAIGNCNQECVLEWQQEWEYFWGTPTKIVIEHM